MPSSTSTAPPSAPSSATATGRRSPPRPARASPAAILETVGQDATEALIAGTIDARTDSHVSRTPLTLDDKGWTDITALLAETLEQGDRDPGGSGRTGSATSKSEAITTKLAILHFETPPAAKGDQVATAVATRAQPSIRR